MVTSNSKHPVEDQEQNKHNSSIKDSINDVLFIIDSKTRAIKLQTDDANATPKSLLQYDHNSERYTFKIDRFIEGHDTLLCDRVEVHFNNIEEVSRGKQPGVYTVEKLEIEDESLPENEQKLIFSWLVSDEATRYSGTIIFSVLFACTGYETKTNLETGETETKTKTVYRWNTGIYSQINVLQGLNCDDEIYEKYQSSYEQFVLYMEEKVRAMSDEVSSNNTEFQKTVTEMENLRQEVGEYKDTVQEYHAAVKEEVETTLVGTVEQYLTDKKDEYKNIVLVDANHEFADTEDVQAVFSEVSEESGGSSSGKVTFNLNIQNGEGAGSLKQKTEFDENVASGINSSSFGKGVKSEYDNQCSTGQFNEVDPEALLMVGNGTSDENRSNAFTVNKDGTATIGKAPVNDMDVVNKKYLVNSISNISGGSTIEIVTVTSETPASGMLTNFDDLDKLEADPSICIKIDTLDHVLFHQYANDNNHLTYIGMCESMQDANRVIIYRMKIIKTSYVYELHIEELAYKSDMLDKPAQAKSFDSYSSLINELNTNASADKYQIGQSFYIKTRNVPDLWVYNVDANFEPYVYVNDEEVVAFLTDSFGLLKVGCYYLAVLETKPDLTDYVKNTDYVTTLNSGVILPSNGGNWHTSGIGINGEGRLILQVSTAADIDERVDYIRAIPPKAYDYALFKALTDNENAPKTGEYVPDWSDENTRKARELLDTPRASWLLFGELEVTQEDIDNAGDEGVTTLEIGDGQTCLPDWTTELNIRFTVPANSNDYVNLSIFAGAGDIGAAYSHLFVQQGSHRELNAQYGTYSLTANFLTKQVLLIKAPYIQGYGYNQFGSIMSDDLNPSCITYCRIGSYQDSFKYPVGTKMKVFYR